MSIGELDKEQQGYDVSYTFEGCSEVSNLKEAAGARNLEEISCNDRQEVMDCIKVLGRRMEAGNASEIINCSHIGIALYKYLPQKDIFKFEIWSQGLVDMTGYSFDDVNNERIIADEHDIALHRKAFKKMLNELEQNPGTIITKEKEFPSAEGVRKVVCMTSTGIKRSDGFYTISLIKDVTYEREAEKRILESEKRFKDFFELSPEASVIYTKEKITLANDAVARLLGYGSKEEVIGLNILDIVNEDFKHVAEMRLCQKDFNPGEVYPTRLLTRQGDVIDAEVAFSVLEYEGQKALHACIRNVTKRKEFERKLRKSEEGYRRLVYLLPDPVYVYDGQRIVYVNASVLRFMKVESEEELIGKRHRELIKLSNNMIRYFSDIMEEVSSTDCTGTWEGRLQRRKDNEYIYVSISIIKIPNGSSREFMIIVKDMEEIKKNEELKIRYDENRRLLEEAIAYDKQKTEFFSNLSHELRTPINIILGATQMSSITMSGYGQLLEDGRLAKYMDIIKQNCLRLIRMTNNLIDITRIDFGYFNMKYSRGDIVSAVENITLSVSEYVQNKGIQMIFDTDREERIIAFDYEKLERILMNLLSNAVKFTESGGYIYVKIKNRANRINISVRDTGIGIPEDMHEMIFERFVQVDKSLSRNAEGSGIGLALVRSLVEMHEGSIKLKSVPGEGSEFTVSLPCDLSENVEAAYMDISKSDECLEKVKVEFSDIYF